MNINTLPTVKQHGMVFLCLIFGLRFALQPKYWRKETQQRLCGQTILSAHSVCSDLLPAVALGNALAVLALLYI